MRRLVLASAPLLPILYPRRLRQGRCPGWACLTLPFMTKCLLRQHRGHPILPLRKATSNSSFKHNLGVSHSNGLHLSPWNPVLSLLNRQLSVYQQLAPPTVCQKTTARCRPKQAHCRPRKAHQSTHKMLRHLYRRLECILSNQARCLLRVAHQLPPESPHYLHRERDHITLTAVYCPLSATRRIPRERLHCLNCKRDRSLSKRVPCPLRGAHHSFHGILHRLNRKRGHIPPKDGVFPPRRAHQCPRRMLQCLYRKRGCKGKRPVRPLATRHGPRIFHLEGR